MNLKNKNIAEGMRVTNGKDKLKFILYWIIVTNKFSDVTYAV